MKFEVLEVETHCLKLKCGYVDLQTCQVLLGVCIKETML